VTLSAEYKLAVLVYQCIRGLAPAGLSGWRSTAHHSYPWSTTTAFIFDLSTGCTINMALYLRYITWRPSFHSRPPAKTWNSLPSEV